MRIVHYVDDFSLGGIVKGGCVLAKAMAEAGHQVWVVAGAGGPRFQESTGNLVYLVRPGSPSQSVLPLLRETQADVLHIHRRDYATQLIRDVAAQGFAQKPLVVSTPVFGRTPDNPDLLLDTRVCLVGIYTFYRFCRWLGQSPQSAVERGIGYVPITPYEAPRSALSALDEPKQIQARRGEFGIDPGKFVVGRLAREHVSKWSSNNESLINCLLESHPDVQWLSIGYPSELGRQRLMDRWGSRFLNLPETADYELIARVLSCFDVHLFFGQGECFASSIAEAAGVGVPTIALATPLRDNGQAEQVIEDENGYLVSSIDQAVRHVNDLMNNSTKLKRLQLFSQSHCRERWSATRAANDLLSLYEFWKSPHAGRPPYVDLMLKETHEFAADYRQRIVDLMGRNAISRLKWRILMAAVENHTLFKFGRAVRRTYHWRMYRSLAKIDANSN